MKNWVGLVGWPCSGRFTHIKCSPIRCRSSVGQGKFAGHRPTFYHCATQTTNVKLRPHHTSNNVEATFSNATKLNVASTKSNVASTLWPKTATMSKHQATKLPVATTLLLRRCGWCGPGLTLHSSGCHNWLEDAFAHIRLEYKHLPTNYWKIQRVIPHVLLYCSDFKTQTFNGIFCHYLSNTQWN